ncbi:MAG: GNAT family N-acetyltransferase [Clostridium argentinense]|uniref:GNAT family N-acetyltransferase n=1 Tax=Clostridium faecium TaxID=2762223 RepID=A0ABR8YUD4_9CLOT|nr:MULTISPECIES: GNAT family N-acetyltransferase [Clostridium]MBD8047840.1 GNAT family N-acetyltransferase [Clostridium faecium]MBS5824667.1 GNAT family N-acetyltransferase [Clostridium argentinense]MDU1349741.1 GNAT family N-acetyltransferase [Clostridium argentinense]
MSNINYINGNIELLDSVKPLWEKLNNHHKENSTNFSHNYEMFTFDFRKKKFYDKNLKVNVDLVEDLDKKTYIGYCISTINLELVGEIESLYLEKEYRNQGIGEELMNRALTYLNENGSKKKIIGVAEGNEKVLDFYKKFNFCKRTVILEEII